MNKYLLLLLTCGIGFSSCENNELSGHSERNSVKVKADKMLVEQGVVRMYALAYSSVDAKPEVISVAVAGDGSCAFDLPDSEFCKLVIVGGKMVQLDQLYNKTYAELQELSAPGADYKTSFPALYFAKEVNLQSLENEPVQLQKSVYRLDVLNRKSDLTIDSCIVENLAGSTPFLEGGRLDASKIRYNKASIDLGDTKSAQTGFYGYASDVAPVVRLYVKESGVSKTIETTLPSSATRNMIYEVALEENTTELTACLSIREWDDGGSVIVGVEDFKFKIDPLSSVFPRFVKISSSLDTIYVPSCDTELLLALDTQTEAELNISGSPIFVEPVSGADYLDNQYRIRLRQKGALDPETITKLHFAAKGSDGFDERAIVIVQQPSRIQLSTSNVITNGIDVVYPDYMDGTLATFKPGYSVSSYDMGSGGAQYRWVDILGRPGKFTIEGAFMPNDKGATGQRQENELSINYSDGVTEVYNFSRVRRSLPVVEFGGKYWSKYNMRGNSKDASAQIGPGQDQSDLWSYLKSCSDSDYLSYLGSEYCGTNPEGLNLEKNAQGTLVYEGYPAAFGSSTIGDIVADTHCPEGYEVPDESDLRTLIGTTTVQLFVLEPGGENTNTYMVDGQRYTANRYRRVGLEKDGVAINDAYHLKITNARGESIVLNGLGFQADPGSVAWGYWLLANASSGNKFPGFNNPRNNFYMQSHSGKKTCLVRCVKKPVTSIIL